MEGAAVGICLCCQVRRFGFALGSSERRAALNRFNSVPMRAGWGAIAAVQDGRVHVISPDIVSRPGPRLVEALETLAGFVYPEVLD